MRNDAEALELFVCVKTRPRVQEQTRAFLFHREEPARWKMEMDTWTLVQGLKVGPFLVAGFEF